MWWRREREEVAAFLYKLLIVETPTKSYARDVAQRMGVPYPTLSKYWLGKRRFPAALVSPLFLATDQDVRVVEFFVLKGSAYRLQRKEAAAPTLEVAQAVMTLSELAGRLSGLCLRATSAESEDGRAISRHEADELASATRAIIRVAEELGAGLGTAAPGRDKS